MQIKATLTKGHIFSDALIASLLSSSDCNPDRTGLNSIGIGHPNISIMLLVSIANNMYNVHANECCLEINAMNRDYLLGKNRT